jgi:hypothetical protein
VKAPRPETLIDLDRYPLGARGERRGSILVDDCRRPQSHHSRVEGTCYLDLPDEPYPADHPRRVLGVNTLAAVAYDRLRRARRRPHTGATPTL